MNVQEQLAVLGLRLEDAANVTFTDILKIRTLRNAEEQLVQLLHPAYLTELEVVEESLTATSGVYPLSSLTKNVLRGGEGVISVKIHDGKYATLYSQRASKRNENMYNAGGKQNPLYVVFENEIKIAAGVTSPVIDVYYLKMPEQLRFAFSYSAPGIPSPTEFMGSASEGLSSEDDYYGGGTKNNSVIYDITQGEYHVITDYDYTSGEESRVFTVAPAATDNFGTGTFYFLTHDFDMLNLDEVTSSLNALLHGLVVTLAEAECWAMDRQLERKESALSAVNTQIAIMNANYSEAPGIGTQGRKATVG